MAKETEIKLPVASLAAFRRKLKRLGAKTVGNGTGRVWEQNIIFDTPQGSLAKQGQLLRVRVETPEGRRGRKDASAPRRVMITFKQPVAEVDGGPSHSGRTHKVREEIEVVASQPEDLARIFAGLGMAGWFRYEKYRTTYRLDPRKKWAHGLLVELDETPIGIFAELEGPGEAIDRAAKELGYSKQDYILKNYLVLYVEDCRRRGEPPQHMLFPARSVRAK